MENARLYKNVQESEDHLRLAIDTIPAMVWSNWPDGSADFLNRRWQEYTGVPLNEHSATIGSLRFIPMT
jgi:PAS domain-containing protein